MNIDKNLLVSLAIGAGGTYGLNSAGVIRGNAQLGMSFLALAYVSNLAMNQFKMMSDNQAIMPTPIPTHTIVSPNITNTGRRRSPLRPSIPGFAPGFGF
jgi:hypothetical protein